MTDAKPDALEELKARHLATAHPMARGCSYADRCEDCAAIAAWEKERAEAQRAAAMLKQCSSKLAEKENDYQTAVNMNFNLRAAVEDARIALLEGMNQRPGAAQVKVLRAVSDALDAALRGGA